MQTDQIDEVRDPGQRPSKPPATPLRRASQIGLAFINPFSDLGVIYRTGVRPLVGRLKLLVELTSTSHSPKESLTWAQAVERTGMPVEHLQATYKRLRLLWWSWMVVAGTLSVGMLLMLLMANNLPGGTMVRAVMAVVLLAALSSVGFVKALIETYRLWQLVERRVSFEERGTFRDFLSENRWCRQVLTLGNAK